MDNWYSKQLGDGMMAPVPSAEIEKIFLSLFESVGRPLDMAVFTRYASEGRLHCDVTAYFSPAATEVAKVFDAQPCAKPVRAELGLLVGDKQAWSVLFPESET
jgi:hypothetical protein